MTELRRYKRSALETEVSFRTAAGGDWLTGRAHDISLGGMFVETSAAQPFGTALTVKLSVHGTDIEAPAVARWTREDGMGIQFGALGARAVHAITEHTRD